MPQQGWYPDPNGRSIYLFFDGTEWRPEMQLPFAGPTPHDLRMATTDLPLMARNLVPSPQDNLKPSTTDERRQHDASAASPSGQSEVRQPDLDKRSLARSRPLVLFIGFVLIACTGLFAIGVISSTIAGSGSQRGNEDPRSFEDWCVAIVENWADTSTGVRMTVALTGNLPGSSALDVEGVYPGGEWRCAGERGTTTPLSVMVYPGGYGSLELDELPEQIFNR